MKRTVSALMLIALITLATAVPSFAGAVGGPRSGFYRLPANSTHTFWIAFRAGERAQISVEGDGDTDLDLYVYDDRGNLISSDDDQTDICFVRMNVFRTSYFKVEVVNRGNVYNDYSIETN